MNVKKDMELDFFCNIKYDWNIYFVLTTNNHVLNKDDIKKGNIIIFSLNNEKIDYKLIFDESRKTYTNEDYDVTIIEIKKEDGLDKISFFDIDNEIFKENPQDLFKKRKYFYYIIQKEREWLVHLG